MSKFPNYYHCLSGGVTVFYNFINIEMRNENTINQQKIRVKIVEFRKPYIFDEHIKILDLPSQQRIKSTGEISDKDCRELNIEPDSLYQIENIEITLTFDTDIFFILKCELDQENFGIIKEASGLNVEYQAFPKVIIDMLTPNNDQSGEIISYRLEIDQDGQNSLVFISSADIKELEVFRLVFEQMGEEEIKPMVQHRFTQLVNDLKYQSAILKELKNHIRNNNPYLLDTLKRGYSPKSKK